MKRVPPVAALAIFSLLAGSVAAAGTGSPPSGQEAGAAGDASGSGSDHWVDARSAKGGFSARMPGVYLDFSRGDVQQGEKVALNGFHTVLPGAFGTVQVWDVVCVDHLERTPTAEAAFDYATNDHEVNGMLRWRRRSDVAGHPALDFAAGDGKRVVRSRVISFGKRVCTIAVNYSLLDPVSDAEAERFIASFKSH